MKEGMTQEEEYIGTHLETGHFLMNFIKQILKL